MKYRTMGVGCYLLQTIPNRCVSWLINNRPVKN